MTDKATWEFVFYKQIANGSYAEAEAEAMCLAMQSDLELSADKPELIEAPCTVCGGTGTWRP